MGSHYVDRDLIQLQVSKLETLPSFSHKAQIHIRDILHIEDYEMLETAGEDSPY